MLGVGWLISHNKSKVVSTMPCRIPSETGVGALEACNTLSMALMLRKSPRTFAKLCIPLGVLQLKAGRLPFFRN